LKLNGKRTSWKASLRSKRLSKAFSETSLRGDAELELIDESDPFSEGVSISVRPKDKSWKKIAHLSGGEKTLTSLSFIFALQAYKPSPFYCMDEIDAALDIRNVLKAALYIRDKAKDSQFLVISLRDQMFE